MGKLSGTLLGGGIGWAFGGPIGGIIGAYIGSMMAGNGASRNSSPYQTPHNRRSAFNHTQQGDFAVAMLALFGYISKADNKVLSSEVQYVKQFLVEKFGKDNAQDLMYLYKEILNKDYNLYDVTAQIKANTDYYARLEMLHILFGIAGADGEFHVDELAAIEAITRGLDISGKDYDSIKSIFIKESDQSYKILGVSPNSDVNTIKKTYRSLATKYHPDKVASLGPEFQKMAEEKFKSINSAYQDIRQQRGF